MNKKIAKENLSLIKNLNITIKTPEKLHEFMTNYNWDDGIEIPLWAIRNPLCDMGTALMIYWMAGAGYFSQFETKDDVPIYEKDNFDLIIEIENRYTTGFYTRNNILFDPNFDHDENRKGHNWVNEYSYLKQFRKIPTEMLSPNKK
jgi:hypothetical protein